MNCRIGCGLLEGLIMLFSYAHVSMSLQLPSGFYEQAAVELKPVVGDFLQEDFRTLDLKGLLDNDLHCSACTLITNILNFKRSFVSFNRRYADGFLQTACSILQSVNLLSASECRGAVNVYADVVLYLINNLNDTRMVCPILLQQYSCTDVPTPAYSISVNGNIPPSKPALVQRDETMPPLRILQITDVHFDPSYQPGKTEADRAGYWTDYRSCDVPHYFIKDSFEQISWNEKFDYIYFTGDIVSHKVWATSKTSILQESHEFWEIFKASYRGYQVFPVLGNHDVHPCNLYAPENMNESEFSVQWLFNAVADFWKDFLPTEALQTVRRGGYYAVKPREGFKVIALNSNVAYYLNFWLPLVDSDPYGQLQWLADELQAAEESGDVVHILSHVPAGAEMANSWALQLRRIVRRYHNIIGGIFNGHTHLDEFSVYYAGDGTPISVAFNGGSLTPFGDVNPNYKIYIVDPITFAVADYETFAMNLTDANREVRERPHWRKQYSLRSEYDLLDASPASMHQLTRRLVRDRQLRAIYFRNAVRFGTPSLINGCDNDCQTKLVCDIVNTVNLDSTFCARSKK